MELVSRPITFIIAIPPLPRNFHSPAKTLLKKKLGGKVFFLTTTHAIIFLLLCRGYFLGTADTQEAKFIPTVAAV